MRASFTRTLRVHLLLLGGLLLASPIAAQSGQWTDATSRFITNPTFDTDSNGWQWEASTGTAGVDKGNMRFYGGSFDFHQQLSGLPKGHYRLSVQSFYRDGGNESYYAHQDGTESMDAYLYAGSNTVTLKSIFSESLSYNAAGRCYTPDNTHYYPDGRDAAGIAFEEGLYWNTLEFDATGNLLIGIACEVSKSANYCVMDNFRLEYQGELPGELDPDQDGWVDVTKYLLTNYDFQDEGQGWTWESTASPNSGYGALEFYNCTFNLWQELQGLPKGKYRLGVQGYYRTGENNNAYNQHQNGSEELTAYLYAGSSKQPLVSIYSVEFQTNLNYSCWGPNAGGGWWGRSDPPFFPNDMGSGSAAFSQDAYQNYLEFNAEGTIRIGLANETYTNANWCMFDNFTLEYQGAIVKASSVSVSLADEEIIVGQQTAANPQVLPENTMVKKVVWTSSDETVATVDAQGMVTGIGEGTAVIKATTVDGSNVTGTATVKVSRNAATAENLVINEIMSSNVDEFISTAFNFDGWIELYNPTSKPASLAGTYISDDAQQPTKWRLPADMGVVPAKGFRIVWFDSADQNHLHAPFKLDVDGGTLYVYDENGQLLAQQSYPSAMERTSYARKTDGGDAWSMATPTFASTNATATFATAQTAAPKVNQPDQLFTGSLSVKVTIPGGATLRYTTDGTLPTLTNGETSTDGQFTVSETTCFRFRLFTSNQLPSRVTTRSYILNDRDYMGPILSVVTDPDFLYDSEIGVMTTGPNGRPGNGRDDNCNWNMNWERPVNFAYMSNGTGLDYTLDQTFNQDANLEMCGGWSRAWTPHSFKLKGNKELGGTKTLNFPFFTAKPYIRNRTLQVRNGGNDTSCRFKDGAIQTIVQTSGIDIDCQSYRPVHEFINGNYIGVLNAREPNNKHFVFANYGWDDDLIDQFEMSPDSGYIQKCGTSDTYNSLVELSDRAAAPYTYEEIRHRLEMDAYTNYMAAEMYLGGTDWPQNNVKGFSLHDNGRFRFVLFDLDFAFNSSTPIDQFMRKEFYTFDPLRPASLGQISQNIDFVTLFRNMLENDTFRRNFIDACCIMGGSVFEKQRANSIIDSLLAFQQPMMRLKNESPSSTANNMKSQFNGRLSTMTNYLRNYFGLDQAIEAKLGSNVAGAQLYVNDTHIPTGQFDGRLFAPVTLRAEAPAGYVFVGWRNTQSGSYFSTKAETDMPTTNFSMEAVFKPDTDHPVPPVRVNEVSASNDIFVSEYYKKGDWLELYNTTDQPVDVEGWILVNDDTKLQRSVISRGSSKANTVIPPHGYLIVWCDKNAPVNQLHADFKLAASGGHLFLMPSDNSWSDSFYYPVHDEYTSVGRYPDGTDATYVFSRPTIEAANQRNSYATSYEDKTGTTTEANLPLVAARQLSLRPLDDRLVLRSTAVNTAAVSIFRANGQLVLSTTVSLTGSMAEVKTTTLQPGYYIAKATGQEGQAATCKFVVK